MARTDPLSRAEDRLLDDLARQAGLVLDHLTLTEAIAGERRAGHLEGLTAREHDVLELISRGLSNAAICDELHLSIKTVEPAGRQHLRQAGAVRRLGQQPAGARGPGVRARST